MGVAAIGGQGKGFAELSMDTIKLAGDVDELTAKLREQLSVMREGTEETKIRSLAQRGASEDQLRGLRDLVRLNEAEKKRGEDLARSKEILDGLRTPMENYQRKMDEIGRLQGQGMLTDFEAKRAAAFANSELYQGRMAGAGGAVELGSREARSAIMAFRSGGKKEPIEDVAQNTQQTVQAVQQQTNVLNDLPNRIGTAIGKFIGETVF